VQQARLGLPHRLAVRVLHARQPAAGAHFMKTLLRPKRFLTTLYFTYVQQRIKYHPKTVDQYYFTIMHNVIGCNSTKKTRKHFAFTTNL
jgi:hypothetical protein